MDADLGSMISNYRSDPVELSYRIAKKYSGTAIERCEVIESFSELRKGPRLWKSRDQMW
jgi:hypothetical protein